MTVTVRFLRLAQHEFDKARRKYARQYPRRAQRFVDAVDHAVQQIANAPNLWPVYQDPFRWIRAGRFPYLLYYRLLDPNTAQVYAVAHIYSAREELTLTRSASEGERSPRWRFGLVSDQSAPSISRRPGYWMRRSPP